MAGWIFGNSAENFIDAPAFSLRLPRSIGRVTPQATEIATGGPDEHRRHTEQPAFALNGIEDFTDQHAATLTEENRVRKSARVVVQFDFNAASM